MCQTLLSTGNTEVNRYDFCHQRSLSEYSRGECKTNVKIKAYYDKTTLPWRHKRRNDNFTQMEKSMKNLIFITTL